jgi:hypothetical protein
MTEGAPQEQPRAPFDSTILEFASAQIVITELLRAFMDTQLFIASAAPAESIRSIEPLLWQHEGANLVGVFTHPDWAVPFADMAPHLAQMSGRKVLGMINTGVGLLVNPGAQQYSFVIPPVAVESMRREFGA